MKGPNGKDEANARVLNPLRFAQDDGERPGGIGGDDDGDAGDG